MKELIAAEIRFTNWLRHWNRVAGVCDKQWRKYDRDLPEFIRAATTAHCAVDNIACLIEATKAARAFVALEGKR